MPTYLDLLPDELYQMIMRPTYDKCVEEVVRRRDLRHRHRTLQGYCDDGDYERLFAGNRSRSHVGVVYAWLVGRSKSGARMWTDGSKLYSYQMVIGYTDVCGYKIVRQRTARNNFFVSVTTSKHCNLAAKFADVTYTRRYQLEYEYEAFDS